MTAQKSLEKLRKVVAKSSVLPGYIDNLLRYIFTIDRRVAELEKELKKLKDKIENDR